jgi:hypothetical protein
MISRRSSGVRFLSAAKIYVLVMIFEVGWLESTIELTSCIIRVGPVGAGSPTALQLANKLHKPALPHE